MTPPSREELLAWFDIEIAAAKEAQISGFKIATEQGQLAGERAYARQCALYEAKQVVSSAAQAPPWDEATRRELNALIEFGKQRFEGLARDAGKEGQLGTQSNYESDANVLERALKIVRTTVSSTNQPGETK